MFSNENVKFTEVCLFFCFFIIKCDIFIEICTFVSCMHKVVQLTLAPLPFRSLFDTTLSAGSQLSFQTRYGKVEKSNNQTIVKY
jgi:hypothetical protein